MPVSVEEASVLWMDAGYMSGGSRSQLEFPKKLGRFFWLPDKARSAATFKITLSHAGITFPDRTMQFHNNYWRLNLPTEAQGIGSYLGKILIFQRTEKRDTFMLWITQPDTAIADELIKHTDAANRKSHKRRVYGGERRYGFF